MTKSIPFYALRYAGYYISAVLIVLAVTYAMYALAPDFAARVLDGGGSTGMNMVMIILPPMLVAQLFYRHERRAMTRRESWGYAALFTILVLVLSLAPLALVTLVVPLTEQERDGFAYLLSGGAHILASVAAVAVIMVLLANKLMLWSGFRGAAKVAAKQAAKDVAKG